MKTYIVYVNGVEVGMIKAGSHNSAEKKAQKKHGHTGHNYNSFGPSVAQRIVSVAYTEV